MCLDKNSMGNVFISRRKWLKHPFNYYVFIEAASVTSEYPQDSDSVCCCYDYRFDAPLQKCVVHCVLCILGCIISDACHAEVRGALRLVRNWVRNVRCMSRRIRVPTKW